VRDNTAEPVCCSSNNLTFYGKRLSVLLWSLGHQIDCRAWLPQELDWEVGQLDFEAVDLKRDNKKINIMWTA